MGQSFCLVNLDKREYVSAWDDASIGKLWEWCKAKHSGIIYFLLRKSSGTGGGDIQDRYETAGRWAGDRIVLIGDYDGSNLYKLALESYKNITADAMKEYKDFIHA